MVLFNHKLKIVVINIPKTGSTTLYERLKHNGFDKDNKLFLKIKKHGDKNYWHLSINQLKKTYLWDKIKNYYFVAFTRNPYDRSYSAYLEIKKRYNIDETFYEYLQKIKNKIYKEDYRYIHGKPMIKFVYDKIDKHFIVRPRKLIILKQDIFEEDLAKLIIFFKLKIKSKKSVNNSDKKIKKPCSYYNKMNKKEINMIKKIYKNDFYVFNYDKKECLFI